MKDFEYSYPRFKTVEEANKVGYVTIEQMRVIAKQRNFSIVNTSADNWDVIHCGVIMMQSVTVWLSEEKNLFSTPGCWSSMFLIPEVQDFHEDIELDALLIYAAMNGVLVPFGIAQGMKPMEMYNRSIWMGQQSDSYMDKVVTRIKSMDLGDILGKNVNHVR